MAWVVAGAVTPGPLPLISGTGGAVGLLLGSCVCLRRVPVCVWPCRCVCPCVRGRGGLPLCGQIRDHVGLRTVTPYSLRFGFHGETGEHFFAEYAASHRQGAPRGHSLAQCSHLPPSGPRPPFGSVPFTPLRFCPVGGMPDMGALVSATSSPHTPLSIQTCPAPPPPIPPCGPSIPTLHGPPIPPCGPTPNPTLHPTPHSTHTLSPSTSDGWHLALVLFSHSCLSVGY